MKVLDKDVTIQLFPATILQVHKHASTGIFTDDRFLPFTRNKLQTNVIVQLKNSGKTLPLNIRDKQLPLHNKQEVDIIKANNHVIGYVDVKREEYYYLTNNFCEIFGFNIPTFFITWITGIVAAASALIFIENNYKPLLAGTLLLITCLLHVGIKFVMNRKIESKIDERLKAFSII